MPLSQNIIKVICFMMISFTEKWDKMKMKPWIGIKFTKLEVDFSQHLLNQFV